MDTRELGYYYDNPLPVGPVATKEYEFRDKLTFRQHLNLPDETERQQSLTLVADAGLNPGDIQDAGVASTRVNGSTITTLAETHLTQPAKILVQPITVPIKTNLQSPPSNKCVWSNAI